MEVSDVCSGERADEPRYGYPDVLCTGSTPGRLRIVCGPGASAMDRRISDCKRKGGGLRCRQLLYLLYLSYVLLSQSPFLSLWESYLYFPEPWIRHLRIENNIWDIAGLRVICSFPEDVYLVKKCILAQDDIRLIKEKDYIMMAMDFWASLEHKLRYKKEMDMQMREEIAGSLQNAADTCYELDRNMELIRNRIQENH